MSYIRCIIIFILIFLCSCNSGYLRRVENRARLNLWIDLYMGEPIVYEEMIRDLKKVQVVYLGEVHTIQRHHDLQKKIIEDLQKSGKSIILGLEQMEASKQKELDHYNRGEIDFNELSEATNWADNWSNYKTYEPIIETVHKSGGVIAALNADKAIIRQVRHKGIDGLSENERKHLPENIFINDEQYRRLIKMLLKVHAMMSPDHLDPVIEAQAARDEKMAEVLSEYIRINREQNWVVVVLCGAVHINYGLGIPDRVRLRIPSIRDRIVIFSQSGDLVLSPMEKAMARDITITHEDIRFLQRPIADYLHVIELKTGSE